MRFTSSSQWKWMRRSIIKDHWKYTCKTCHSSYIYVYGCVCVCVCAYAVYMCICIFMCIYVCAYFPVYICKYICMMSLGMGLSMYTCICMFVCTYVCLCIYIYEHMCICNEYKGTCVCICIHPLDTGYLLGVLQMSCFIDLKRSKTLKSNWSSESFQICIIIPKFYSCCLHLIWQQLLSNLPLLSLSQAFDLIFIEMTTLLLSSSIPSVLQYLPNSIIAIRNIFAWTGLGTRIIDSR